MPNIIRTIIESAVATAVAKHPKYFTPRGLEKAPAAIVREIMAAFRGDDDSGAEIPAPEKPYVLVDQNSREARGYAMLRHIAGATPPRPMSDGCMMILRSACNEAVFTLANVPPSDQWPFVRDVAQINAWMEFFNASLPDVPRRAIADPRGIRVPGYWPPSKAGKLYLTEEAA